MFELCSCNPTQYTMMRIRTVARIFSLCGLFTSLVAGKADIGLETRAPIDYDDYGCYGPLNPLPFFRGVSLSGMTVNKCAISCRDFLYFALTDGDQCWCGDSISLNSARVGDSVCNQACSGSNRLGQQDDPICGTDAFWSVFRKEAPGVQPIIPTTITYNPVGCYHEPDPSQTILSDTLLFMSQSTVQTCEAL